MINPIILALFTILLCPLPVQAQKHTGKVVGITDGDTFTLLLLQKNIVKVRLAEIDAPEKKTAIRQFFKANIVIVDFWKGCYRSGK